MIGNVMRNAVSDKYLEDDVLSPRAVEAAVTLNNSTIWRMRRRGEFPEPIRLSPGRVGYRRRDIEKWLSTRCNSLTKGTTL